MARPFRRMIVYKGKKGWEFKVLNRNGVYLCGSKNQGYANQSYCIKMADSIMMARWKVEYR